MFITFIALVQIIIYAIILWYIHMLEKTECYCTKDVKRDAIKFIVSFLFVVSVILIILSFSKIDIGFFKIFRPFLNIAGLLNLILTTWYFIELQKKKNCSCSKDPKRYFLLGPIILQIILLIYVILIIQNVLPLPNEIIKSIKNIKKINKIKAKKTGNK
jgi:hypothetical protein